MSITDSPLGVCTQYAALLARDEPDANTKGLWFGLVQLVKDKKATTGTIVPYIAGASGFDPKDSDRPCEPVWMASDCDAPNPAMDDLSALRTRHQRRAWSVETVLIEPLHALDTGAFAGTAWPELLLGPARSRGIGCGFDSGDVNTLGVVTKNGFKTVKQATARWRCERRSFTPSAACPSPRPDRSPEDTPTSRSPCRARR